ncbi:ABC transporter ATP-binding protein [Abyssisolibacter fermentans]|uniref:ABC transporter ATP-binding protein n=1 Tax=Abyssisolibacter fermentans TaxID=1766203 RepID=UPI00082A7256|nr:ABC transporter ATP-binding protein [Abyssisolibacter fermentans]
MNRILDVKDVSKHFKKFTLNHVSLQLKENCITGFLGKNGAGKTTLIKIILGLLKKDSGEVIFFSNRYGDIETVKNKIGVVLDNGYFYENLNLKQMKNVIASTYRQWDEHTYQKYLKKFQLSENQLISSLSKGMKMKYALTLALSHGADLLIMDEPTSGLDPEIRKELIDILGEYVQKEGKSVFFSTHITSDLERCADEIVIINNGEIMEQMSKDEMIESYRMIKGTLDDLKKIPKKSIKILDQTKYGFIGITSYYEEIKRHAPKVLLEKATLEDIFLAKTGGVGNEDYI